MLLLEQDKATTHPLIYLKYVLIELLLFARDHARSWGYSHKKYSPVLCSHGPDLVELRSSRGTLEATPRADDSGDQCSEKESGFSPLSNEAQ